MYFKCEQSQLMEALNNVSRAVPVKSTIPALEGIMLSLDQKKLELTGYDMNLGIHTYIDVESDDTGSFIVTSKTFMDIIRNIDSDTVSVEVNGKAMTIMGNKAEYNIPVISADEYPSLPDDDIGDYFVLPQSLLKNMINHTIFSVATEEKKPVFTGELFDISDNNFNLVAIDGYRLAIRHEKIATDGRYNMVVKAKALAEVAKILKDEAKEGDNVPEVTVCVSKKHTIFKIDRYNIISRLLEGEFYNYKNSLPTSFVKEVKVNTKDFTRTIERCSLLISDRVKNPVRCSFTEDKVVITCVSPLGHFHEELEIETNDENIDIGFNSRYLLEALKAVSDCEMIKLKLNGSVAPMVITPVEGDEFTFLVLPIRIRN